LAFLSSLIFNIIYILYLNFNLILYMFLLYGIFILNIKLLNLININNFMSIDILINDSLYDY